MNRLRNLLKSEKLSLSQYFEEAYKLFNEMIRDDNKDIMIIMFLSLISVLLRNIIGTLVSFAMLIRIWFFYRKVIFKIEGKRYETGDATVKSFVLLGISLLAVLLVGLLMLPYISGIIGMTLYGGGGIGVLAAIIIPIIILIVVFIVVLLFILYFIPAYMSRNGSIGETFKYNLFLCKNDRMRMFLPVIILLVSGFVLGIVLGIVFEFFGTVGTIIGALISSAINLFQVIIVSIIYLNVEYNTEIPEEFSFTKENYKNKANKAADENKKIENKTLTEEKKDDENN